MQVLALAACLGGCAHGYVRWAPPPSTFCLTTIGVGQSQRRALVLRDPSAPETAAFARPETNECQAATVPAEMIISHCGSKAEADALGLKTEAAANAFQECLKVRGTFGMYRALHIHALDPPLPATPASLPFWPDDHALSNAKGTPLDRSAAQAAPQLQHLSQVEGAAIPASQAFQPGDHAIFPVTAPTEQDGQVSPELQVLSRVNGARLSVMYQQEFDALKQAKGADYARYIGVALSGGGIRSASFSSGALMSLHDLGLLEHSGYLSTVSGGGFAGAWLMMHPSVTPGDLFQPGGRDLHHLSQFGSYLTSRNVSQTTTGLVGQLFLHATFLPFHWLLNGVFDLNVNVPLLRWSFRRGIAAAFEYKTALASGDPASDVDHLLGMGGYKPDGYRPLWIINMHLALNDDTGFYKARTGDAVEVTPFRAGGDAVGYITELPVLMCRTCDAFWTAPYYAVGASGAAFDGKSGQQGTLLSAGLWLLNLNLGYNVASWAPKFTTENSFWRNLAYYATSPLPFYLISSLHQQRPTSKSLLLTDGGHFDTIGLYALIRRGVRLIIAIDGAEDDRINEWCAAHRAGDYGPLEAAFGDLHATEEKLYSDFGATIAWHWEQICAEPTGGFRDRVPTHVFTGSIHGLPVPSIPKGKVAPDVLIVYVKAAYSNANGMLKASSFIDANKVADPAFPNNSTGDQFYTERQILSYRELGRRMIESGSWGAQMVKEGVHRVCAEIADTADVNQCERWLLQPVP